MRRAFAIVLLSGAALLFAFRFEPPPSGVIEAEGEIIVPPVETTSTTTTLVTGATAPLVRPPTTTTTLSLGPGVQIVESPLVQTNRGSLQLEIKVFDGVLADVRMIVTPSESRRARDISTDEAKRLRVEALEMQTSRLHNVSGATETSRAYMYALHMALIEVGIMLPVS